MEIRPKSFGDALNQWFHSLGKGWKALLGAAMVVHIPVAIVLSSVLVLTGADVALQTLMDPDVTEPAALEALGPLLWVLGVLTILQTLGFVFVNLAAARAIAGQMTGEGYSWRQVSRFAWSRFGAGLVWSLLVALASTALVGVAVGLGWALIAPSGVNFLTVFLTATIALTDLVVLMWLAVSVSLGAQAIAMEGAGAVDAIKRSFRLVQARWWITLGFLAICGLIAYAAAQVASLVLTPLFLVGAFIPETLAVGFGLSVIFQGPVVAAMGASYAVWYIDLRARREHLTADQLI